MHEQKLSEVYAQTIAIWEKIKSAKDFEDRGHCPFCIDANNPIGYFKCCGDCRIDHRICALSIWNTSGLYVKALRVAIHTLIENHEEENPELIKIIKEALDIMQELYEKAVKEECTYVLCPDGTVAEFPQ